MPQVVVPNENVSGFEGTVDDIGWAECFEAAGFLANVHGVLSGITVTPGAGLRELVIGEGKLFVPGVRADPPQLSVFGDAHTSAGTRLDLLYFEADWTWEPDPPGPNGRARFVLENGSTSSFPTAGTEAGNVWQMPVARIRTRQNAAAFLPGDIERCAPLPRGVRRYSADIPVAEFNANNVNPRRIVTLDVADPGYPYWLGLGGQVLVSADFGVVRLDAYVTSNTGDWQRIGASASAQFNEGRDLGPIQMQGIQSPPLTGARSVAINLTHTQSDGKTDFNVVGDLISVLRVLQYPNI